MPRDLHLHGLIIAEFNFAASFFFLFALYGVGGTSSHTNLKAVLSTDECNKYRIVGLL